MHEESVHDGFMLEDEEEITDMPEGMGDDEDEETDEDAPEGMGDDEL